ncbi:Uma2 family endonuclease, partial [Actinoplanes sp. NPDC048988]|uniref:Uma2 family endonuclease n=1 Tax=Actinoplanes sp. NPDC048988 TaxID=3363901 RepID=UPI003720F097
SSLVAEPTTGDLFCYRSPTRLNIDAATKHGLVIKFEAAKSGRGKFPASDVVLVAEMVSPSTKGTDRVTKPTGYAHAGIPYFWLIETLDGLEVTTFELNSETQSYDETGFFSGDDTLRAEQPWKIEIPLASIRPRNL